MCGVMKSGGAAFSAAGAPAWQRAAASCACDQQRARRTAASLWQASNESHGFKKTGSITVETKKNPAILSSAGCIESPSAFTPNNPNSTSDDQRAASFPVPIPRSHSPAASSHAIENASGLHDHHDHRTRPHGASDVLTRHRARDDPRAEHTQSRSCIATKPANCFTAFLSSSSMRLSSDMSTRNIE